MKKKNMITVYANWKSPSILKISVFFPALHFSNST